MNVDKKARNIVIGAVVGFIVLVLIIVAISVVNTIADKNKSDSIHISNLDACSANMQQSLKDSLRTNMYIQIRAANDYNKKETLPNYEGVIREGTCKEEDITSNSMTGETTFKETTAILDIPTAEQSWAITYNWQTNGKPIKTDFGTIIMPECLPEKDLIYGDFNCEKIMSLQQYGTDKYDAILQYMPYTGSGFSLEYNPETKAVAATIELRASQMENQELINNLKIQVELWFSSRDLVITDYTVTYTLRNISEEPLDGPGTHYHGDEDLIE